MNQCSGNELKILNNLMLNHRFENFDCIFSLVAKKGLKSQNIFIVFMITEEQ